MRIAGRPHPMARHGGHMPSHNQWLTIMRHELWFRWRRAGKKSGVTAGETGFWSYGVCKELSYPIESTNTPYAMKGTATPRG